MGFLSDRELAGLVPADEAALRRPQHRVRVAEAMQRLVEAGTHEPTFKQVCAELGLLSIKEMTLQAQNQIGRALTALGWVGQRLERNGVRDTFYSRL